MAFDEQGQADAVERSRICSRAYRISPKIDFPLRILFSTLISLPSPRYRRTQRLRRRVHRGLPADQEHAPGAKVSGGLSNLSFSFRGNEPVREAIHSVFLYHAIQAGMDMIVNAGQLAVYADIPAELRDPVEDVVLNRRPLLPTDCSRLRRHSRAAAKNAR